ncbi:fiber protein pIV [Human adenovirus 22]|uniref:Fiber protein n=2 Tax=Human adenovirus 22 TaxID=46924 RepID=C5HDT4_9ADEN|nr:fiber protein pIV [Human adenovirus 22]ACR81625.1 fiber protein [Human adenovirus 22]
MSKRLRVEDDFNPVYPYGHARNQNIPFLTPPFVSSDGFQNFPPGVLSLKLADPITIANGNVSLKVGGGLTVQDGTGDLIVNAKAPLQVANKKLEIAFDTPLYEKNGRLALKTGHGLAVLTKDNTVIPDLIGTLVILTGKGIGTGSVAGAGTIDVRLGNDGGLSFDKNGDLVAWNKKDDRRTLWTTPDPSPNCTISEDKDSKLTLILTKCGSQILASFSLLVVKGTYATVDKNTTKKEFSIKLLFDANGKLKSESNLSGYWNYRSDNSVVGTAYNNAVPFMPNTTAYPKIIDSTTNPADKKSSAKKIIVGNVYLGGNPGQPVAVAISFNKETTADYSITFDFAWGKAYETPVPFDTSSMTFSYIAQENEDKTQ